MARAPTYTYISYLIVVNITGALIQSVWHWLEIYGGSRYLFGGGLQNNKDDNHQYIFNKLAEPYLQGPSNDSLVLLNQ